MGAALITKGCLAVTLLAAVLVPQEAIAQERFALVVEGAPGETKFADQHAVWREKLATVLREGYKLQSHQLIVLAGTPTQPAQPAQSARISTASSVRASFARIAAAMRPGDLALIVLIGHGTFDGEDAKFNLVGPDLSAAEWKALLQTLPGEVVFVNTAGASSPFLSAVAGPRRVVITATAQPAQRFHTVFAEYFIEGLAQGDADIDRNGRCSVYEAFAYASLRVRQHYEQRGQLATERAMLDDDGDGRGREAGGEGKDGERASLAYLDADRAAIVTDPDLLRLIQRRDAIVAEVEELKKRRLMMQAPEYDGLLEQLLIDLALVSRDIRART
ncbi:MAG: hypothetical protein M3R55_13220 [Acidobacteriota bacterium]|nr:hypothetical protein [Acidobacteriota bacterium]